MEVCSHDVVLAVDRDEMWSCKLKGVGAAVAKSGHKAAVGLEDADARAFVVHHDDVAVPVRGHSFRPWTKKSFPLQAYPFK